MNFMISTRIKEKLLGKTPPVREEELVQCFSNHSGKFLIDTREDHKTDPATLWFIAETNAGRKLKVVFVPMEDGIHIKSAYEPEPAALRIYNKYA
jgi:hypothetical protein